jgi:hypothetical protein
MDTYLIGLCRDYVDLVDMYSGRSDIPPEEMHEIDSQRQVTHRQICEHTGEPLSANMYRYAKTILHYARAGGVE